MATRSRIAIENPDGTVRSIYCHWDGYPEHNGVLLHTHYQDPKKVESLIQLGSISLLAEEVEPTGAHSFEQPQESVTVAYHRDRGEEYRAPRVDPDPEHYFRRDIEEWGYLFTKAGEWVYVSGSDRHPRLLKEVVSKQVTNN